MLVTSDIIQFIHMMRYITFQESHYDFGHQINFRKLSSVSIGDIAGIMGPVGIMGIMHMVHPIIFLESV